MPAQQPHELDASVREASLQLQGHVIGAPEVLLLLATGAEDVLPLMEDPQELSLSELSGTPTAWNNSVLIGGKLNGVRIWLCEDAPRADVVTWARPWLIWLARQCGAGRALLTIGASPLTHATEPCPTEGFFLTADHLMLEGATPLSALSHSNLGPLFPDQGRVHDKTAQEALLLRARSLGLPCDTGVLACIPGPALETPAEQRYHALAGAHASAQNIGALYHAMAHSGLSGITIAALLGEGDAKVEDLVASAQRLAPGLIELIVYSTELLAANTRAEVEGQL
jgi:purine-nucleoside phosphorylase